MRIEIRPGTANDAEAISNIHASSWKAAYHGIVPQQYLDELKNDFWVPAFRDWITNNTLKTLIICQDSVPVGCCAYGQSRDEKLAGWGEIVSLYIQPDYYRKGYGKRLLDRALLDMRQAGYRNCYLWVLKDNKNAQGFYEKNGFRCNHDEYEFEIMGERLVDIRYIVDFG